MSQTVFEDKEVMAAGYPENRLVTALRRVGTLEGISYLLLLAVAMPIKYIYGEPLLVRIVGSAHGLLFVIYILLGAYVGKQLGWRTKDFTLLLIASIVPFGPFFFDRRLKDTSLTETAD